MTDSSGANTGPVSPTIGPIEILIARRAPSGQSGIDKPGDQPPDQLTALDQQLLSPSNAASRAGSRDRSSLTAPMHPATPHRQLLRVPATCQDGELRRASSIASTGATRPQPREPARATPGSAPRTTSRCLATAARTMQRRRDGVHVRQHRRVIGVLLEHHEDVHSPLL